MRILHTSDWHLGRIFHGRHLTGEQEYVLEQFCDVARDARPDVILIAGDVYDRAVPPVDAVNLLDDVLHRLVVDLKVPIITIAGNHDSPDRLSFGRRLFHSHGLAVYGQPQCPAPVVTLQDGHGPVHFLPIPYAEPPFVREALGDEDIAGHEAALAAQVAAARAASPAGRCVAVAHCFLTGGQASDSERPLTVGGAGAVPCSLFDGFAYTALGHLHRPQSVSCDAVRYSGSLMKYSFDEANHRKGIVLAELDAQGHVSAELIELKPRLNVRCVTGTLEELLRQGEADPCRDDFIQATLTDEGALLDAMGQLRRVYPNALQIQRAFLPGGQAAALGGDYRKHTDFDLFCAFYRQTTGRELGEDTLAALREVLHSLREQNEVGA